MKRWLIGGLAVILMLAQPHPAQAEDDLSKTINCLRASPVCVVAGNAALSTKAGDRLRAQLQPGDHILIAAPSPNAAAQTDDAEDLFYKKVQAQFPDTLLFVQFNDQIWYIGQSAVPITAYQQGLRTELHKNGSTPESVLNVAITLIHDYEKAHPQQPPQTSQSAPQPSFVQQVEDFFTPAVWIRIGIVSGLLVVLAILFRLLISEPKRRRHHFPDNYLDDDAPPILRAPGGPQHVKPPVSPAGKPPGGPQGPGRAAPIMPRLSPNQIPPRKIPESPRGNPPGFNQPWPGKPAAKPQWPGKPVANRPSPPKPPTHVLPKRPHANITPLAATDPKRIWEYELLGVVGVGGFGKVYAGVRPDDPTTAAIKVISPQVSHLPDFKNRFEREIQACHKLPDSPHIVRLLFSQSGGTQPWLATRFVNALDLNRLVREHNPRGLPTTEVIALIREIAVALEDVHNVGIVHRDIKPANILMPPEGAMLTDFGIARIVGGDVTLTATGVAIGTPAYMAPEYFTGENEPSASADMFSFGATLFCAITGEDPFTGRQEKIMADVMYKHPKYELVRDRRVREIIRSCMHKDPSMRPTATEVLQRLKRR